MQTFCPAGVFGTHQHILIRRFSNPIVCRSVVNIMHSHVCVGSCFYQTSRCLQHEIIPFARFNFTQRFLLCAVYADCDASVLTDHELGALECNSVGIDHFRCPQNTNINCHGWKS